MPRAKLTLSITDCCRHCCCCCCCCLVVVDVVVMVVVVGHLHHHHLLYILLLFSSFIRRHFFHPVFFICSTPLPRCVLAIRIRKININRKRKRLVYFLTIPFHRFKSEFCSIPGMSGMVARYLSILRLNASVCFFSGM